MLDKDIHISVSNGCWQSVTAADGWPGEASVFMVVVLTRCRPTKDISIEFEIRSKSVVLCFEMYSADDNGIFH